MFWLCRPSPCAKGDEDYAISFAVPTDAKGITLIYGRQSCDTRKTEEHNDIDVGNKVYGGHEVLVIFDRVFIPNDMHLPQRRS